MNRLSDADRMAAVMDETNALIAENHRLVAEAHNLVQVQCHLVTETWGLVGKLRQEVQVSRALAHGDLPSPEPQGNSE